MIPPLVRRCPDCGHLTWSGRFDAVADETNRVECPACDHQFETVDAPWLQ